VVKNELGFGAGLLPFRRKHSCSRKRRSFSTPRSEFKQAMAVFQQVYRVEAKGVTSERKITARLSAATGSWLLLCAMS
jgi:hypothetical protein